MVLQTMLGIQFSTSKPLSCYNNEEFFCFRELLAYRIQLNLNVNMQDLVKMSPVGEKKIHLEGPLRYCFSGLRF